MDTISSVKPSQQAKATMEALEQIRKDLSVHCDAVYQTIENSNRNSATQPVDGNTAPSLEQHMQPLSSPQTPIESTTWNPESSSNHGKYIFSSLKILLFRLKSLYLNERFEILNLFLTTTLLNITATRNILNLVLFIIIRTTYLHPKMVGHMHTS